MGSPEGSMCTNCGKIYAGPHTNEYAGEHARIHTHRYKGHNYSGGLCPECAPSSERLRQEVIAYRKRREARLQHEREHGV